MCTLSIGDCLYLPNQKNDKEHLYFIISHRDENGYVLFVNISSLNNAFIDKACILDRKDHEKVKHPSFIKYSDAFVGKIDSYESLIQHGILKPEEPLKPEVLKRIQDEAKKSMKFDYEKYRKYFNYL